MKIARPEKSHLRDLVIAVEAFIIALDIEMKPGVSTVERGQRIGRMVSKLELAKDLAKRFGLGVVKGSAKARPAARIAKRATPPSADQ